MFALKDLNIFYKTSGVEFQVKPDERKRAEGSLEETKAMAMERKCTERMWR